jgi:hypothetical protein
VVQSSYDATLKRVEHMEQLEQDLAQEISAVTSSPLNVSLTGDDEEEVAALQESNNHLDQLNAELADVQMRVGLARLVRSKRKAELSAATIRVQVCERMEQTLENAENVVHTKTEEQYYHAAHVVSEAFVVPRADVKRLHFASASYVDRLLSLRNGTEYIVREAKERVLRNQEHIKLSVERVNLAVAAACKHAAVSEDIAATMESEATEDRAVALNQTKQYNTKRLRVQQELVDILANISSVDTINTVALNNASDAADVAAGTIEKDEAEQLAAEKFASDTAVGETNFLETNAGNAFISGCGNGNNETVFEKQARVTLENYRNSMSMRIAADLDVLFSANESLALIDQSIANIHARVKKLNGLIAEGVQRVDTTMRKECQHVQDVVYQRILHREHRLEIDQRANADSEMARALVSLRKVEALSRATSKEHQEEQHNFAVAAADLVWIQEHLTDEHGNEEEAIAVLEAAREKLTLSKQKVQAQMVAMEEERARFQEVVDASAVFEITAAFHAGAGNQAGSDTMVNSVIRGEQSLTALATRQMDAANAASMGLGYQCRTDTALSSKAEALLRQAQMFVEQGERTEKNAQDDMDKALEDIDYVHCSPEVKATIHLAEVSLKKAQIEVLRLNSVVGTLFKKARDANKVRARACSRAESERMNGLDASAAAKEEQQVVAGAQALAQIETPPCPTETGGATGGATGSATGSATGMASLDALTSATGGATGGATGLAFVGTETGGEAATGSEAALVAAEAEEGVAERAEREAAARQSAPWQDDAWDGEGAPPTRDTSLDDEVEWD